MASLGARVDLVRTTLQILATTDLHAQLRPFDYGSGEADDVTGLAAALSMIDALRAAPGPTLLVDNGDFLCGGELGDRAIHRDDSAPNPVVAAMNAARYDAVSLGNHEFDQGHQKLARALETREWPVISASVVHRLGRDPTRDIPFVAPWCLVERAVAVPGGAPRRLGIGVIGVTPLSAAELQSAEGDLELRDMREALAAHLPGLRAAGADVVVALCHTGLPGHGRDVEDAALELAAIPGIDAMVLGHRHMVFPGPGHAHDPRIDAERGLIAGVPAVMPGFRGRHVGRIALSLRHDGARWSVEGAEAACLEVESWMRATHSLPARAILDLTDAAHRAWLDESGAAIGHTNRTLHTYFARLGRCRATQLVAHAQRAAMAPILAAAGLGHLPQIGVAAPVRSGGRGGARNYVDVPPGLLTRGDAVALYPYHNGISALRLLGADLIQWLERAVSAFHRFTPGRRAGPLVKSTFPAFDFDLPESVGFVVDLSAPARYDARGMLVDREAARVSEVTWNGRPVDPGEEIVLVVNSFRGFGGGTFPGAGREAVVATSGIDVQTAIAELGQAGLPDLPTRHFRFRRVPGASAIFDTGLRAIPHLQDIGDLPVEMLREAPPGFLRLRLDLDALEP